MRSIIEDDAYDMLVSDPLRAMSAIAPEISYHVATLSKVLSPALRIAYVARARGRRDVRAGGRPAS